MALIGRPVSRVLYPEISGRRSSIWDFNYSKPLAANPGTGRAPSVPLLGLAPSEVYHASGVAIGAVSSYLAISTLPR